MKNLEYKVLSSIEGRWGNTDLGIKLMVAGDLPDDMKAEGIDNLVWNFVDKLKDEILAQRIAENPQTAINAKEEKDQLLACFPEHIFVDEYPNGYLNNSYYFRHLPWFVVTTKLGRIKIGWRSRVINIDWSDSIIDETAEELFPDEDVTKIGKVIHAWSLEDAKRYIETLGIKN